MFTVYITFYFYQKANGAFCVYVCVCVCVHAWVCMHVCKWVSMFLLFFPLLYWALSCTILNSGALFKLHDCLQKPFKRNKDGKNCDTLILAAKVWNEPCMAAEISDLRSWIQRINPMDFRKKKEASFRWVCQVHFSKIKESGVLDCKIKFTCLLFCSCVLVIIHLFFLVS